LSQGPVQGLTGRIGGVGGPENRRILLEPALVNERRELRDRSELGHRPHGKAAIADRSMARHDGAGHVFHQSLDGHRPVERVRIAEEGWGVSLDEVAGEQNVGVGNDHGDVVVGVTAAQVAQLDRPTASVELETGELAVEGPVGRVQDDLGQRLRKIRDPFGDLRELRPPGLADHPGAPFVAPDRDGPETMVAKGVVVMAVRVDDGANRQRRELAEVGDDFVRLSMGDPRVDDQDAVVAKDGADVLVIEGVAANEDTVADLGPDGHGRRVAVRLPTMRAMALSTTSTATTRDGTDLLVRHWPAAGQPWAHVLIVHGIAEHSGRYERVGGWLAAAGLDVDAYDQRGFGASSGRRAWLDRWSRNHDDLEERLVAVRAAAGGLPVFIYGHSLGGLIALGYAVADPPRPQPDGYVLSAPATTSGIPAWKQAMARVLGRLVPGLSIPNGFDSGLLSRDPEVGRRYAADPLHQHTTTARFGLAAINEQARVRSVFARLAVPTLVIHGGDDLLVPTVASVPLAALPGVTRRTYPGLRHETHNEPEGREVVEDVIAWLRATLAGRAPRSI
jgi:acylglycerol lipase